MSEKIINLVLVHLLTLSGLFLVGYLIHDYNIINQKKIECREKCYPAKAIETLYMKKCLCEEIPSDEEEN